MECIFSWIYPRLSLVFFSFFIFCIIGWYGVLAFGFAGWMDGWMGGMIEFFFRGKGKGIGRERKRGGKLGR